MRHWQSERRTMNKRGKREQPKEQKKKSFSLRTKIRHSFKSNAFFCHSTIAAILVGGAMSQLVLLSLFLLTFHSDISDAPKQTKYIFLALFCVALGPKREASRDIKRRRKEIKTRKNGGASKREEEDKHPTIQFFSNAFPFGKRSRRRVPSLCNDTFTVWLQWTPSLVRSQLDNFISSPIFPCSVADSLMCCLFLSRVVSHGLISFVRSLHSSLLWFFCVN